MRSVQLELQKNGMLGLCVCVCLAHSVAGVYSRQTGLKWCEWREKKMRAAVKRSQWGELSVNVHNIACYSLRWGLLFRVNKSQILFESWQFQLYRRCFIVLNHEKLVIFFLSFFLSLFSAFGSTFCWGFGASG